MPDVIARGLDYSARRISGAAIKEAGYSFVFRYLWFNGQGLSYLTPEEYKDLTVHGVDVHAIYERYEHDPSGGAWAGKRNAAEAVQSARAVGLPKGSVIWLCSDAPRSKWNYTMDTAMAYLDGARPVIEESGYVLGAYGFIDFILAAMNGGHADRFWLAGSESGVTDGIHAYQLNYDNVHIEGVECDINHLFIPIGDDEMTADELLDTPISVYLPDGTIEKSESIRNILGWSDANHTQTRADVAELKAAVAGLVAKLDNITGAGDANAVAELAKAKIVEDLND